MLKTLPVILAAAFLANYAFLAYNVTGLFRQHKDIRKDDIALTEESVLSNENSFVQNNEDLLNADYKNFYEDLKPYGTWIEVNLKNKSVEPGVNTERDKLSDAVRSVLGIKDAKADVDVGWSVFFVWQPAPGMAVSIAAGDPSPGVYVPYTNGQWVYTDYGWYFRAGTPYEELTHHYGRWVYAVPYGWIWIPGNRWAPAWVSWDYDDDYVAWTPGSPGIYYAVNYYGLPYRLEPNYIVCERRHFVDPFVYRYSGFYREREFERKFDRMKIREGNMYAGNRMRGFGPDFNSIQKDYGRKIERVRINTVNDREKVRYGDKQYSVYAPGFKDKQNNSIKNKSGSERELKQINRNSLSSGTEKNNRVKEFRGNDYKNQNKDRVSRNDKTRSGRDKNGVRNNDGMNKKSPDKSYRDFGNDKTRTGRDKNVIRNNDRTNKKSADNNFRRGKDNSYTGKQERVFSGKQKQNKSENVFSRGQSGRNENNLMKGNQQGYQERTRTNSGREFKGNNKKQ